MNTRKTIITCILTLLAAVCVFFGVGAMNGKIGAQSGTDVFEMVALYKLRLNGNGFAFTVKMNGIVKQTVNDNLYFLIAPKASFDGCDEDGVGYERLIKAVGEDVVYSKVTNIYKKAEGGVSWYANCGIENVSEKDRTTKYRAVAVIETETEGNVTYRFANGIAENDLYDVVAGGFYGGVSLSDIVLAYGNWFGSSKYPIPVDTQTEYNKLKSIAATEEGSSFITGKKIAVDESVNRSDNALNPYTSNIITTYTVRWFDYDGRLLEKDKYVKYGETPAYDGVALKREGHKFIGWDKEISSVVKSVDYVAVYSETHTDPEKKDLAITENGIMRKGEFSFADTANGLKVDFSTDQDRFEIRLGNQISAYANGLWLKFFIKTDMTSITLGGCLAANGNRYNATTIDLTKSGAGYRLNVLDDGRKYVQLPIGALYDEMNITDLSVRFYEPVGGLSFTLSEMYIEEADALFDRYVITVVNGTGSGTYSSGENVTITCDDDVETETYFKTFVGWKKNGSEAIISTKRSLNIVVSENTTYTAVYEVEDWTGILF